MQKRRHSQAQRACHDYRKLGAEQDLTKIDIAVFLLRARTNRFEDLRPLAPALLERLEASVSSGLTILES